MANLLYDALIAPHAANTAPFLIGDDGRSQSYADFLRRAAQIANLLAAHGLRPDDRVVAQVPKVADAVALYAGTVQAGAVYLPLNPDTHRRNLPISSPMQPPRSWSATARTQRPCARFAPQRRRC